MDEVEACLTSLTLSVEEADRKAYGECDLLEVDRVYAVNTSIDQVSSVVLGYEQEDEEERRLNNLAIAALLQSDKEEAKRSVFLDMIEAETAKAMSPSLSRNREILEGSVKNPDNLVVLTEIVKMMLDKGTDMALVGMEIKEFGFYEMKVHVKYSSTLSKEEEAGIAAHFKKEVGWCLSFYQTFSHVKREHTIHVEALLPDSNSPSPVLNTVAPLPDYLRKTPPTPVAEQFRKLKECTKDALCMLSNHEHRKALDELVEMIFFTGDKIEVVKFELAEEEGSYMIILYSVFTSLLSEDDERVIQKLFKRSYDWDLSFFRSYSLVDNHHTISVMIANVVK